MKKLLIGTIALGMLGSASADTVTGQIDLTVTMPEVLVLYHWDSAHLQFAPTNYNVTTGKGALTDSFGNTTYTITDAGATTAPAPAISGSALNTTEPLANSTSVVDVTLKNSWAVRNIATAGATDVSLTVSVPNATLKNVDKSTATMTVSGAQLASTATGTGETVNLPPSWTPVAGDLSFKLDLANANFSGQYTSDGAAFPAGGPSTSANKTFELTLTGPTTSSPAVKTVDVTQ